MKKHSPNIIMILIVILLAGCGGEEEQFPDCPLECDIDSDNFNVDVTCEEGMVRAEWHDQTEEQEIDDDGILLSETKHLNLTAIYLGSANEYEIEGFRQVFTDGHVNYEVTVSGGVYGDQAQYCTP